MVLKVDNVGAERMYSAGLSQASGPATHSFRLLKDYLVRSIFNVLIKTAIELKNMNIRMTRLFAY